MPIVPINHTDIYIEEHGSGEPLFLLHGFGSSTRDWEAQLPDLADRFRVVLVDFRGLVSRIARRDLSPLNNSHQIFLRWQTIFRSSVFISLGIPWVGPPPNRWRWIVPSEFSD